ncbi:hypothetical protein CBM2599_B50984 [Cupriavidus taiwanensis]|nr:hypothetical protein CBM2600_B10007 [Cupriavidus taiwanensis]SOY97238.1 hypothetical protein CBM2599_B50984 [Cupriavidus taiwanensis]
MLRLFLHPSNSEVNLQLSPRFWIRN